MEKIKYNKNNKNNKYEEFDCLKLNINSLTEIINNQIKNGDYKNVCEKIEMIKEWKKRKEILKEKILREV
jgi:hypothetical protein